MKNKENLSSEQFIEEIYRWLCFNTEPSSDKIDALKKGIQDYLKSKFKAECVFCGSDNDECKSAKECHRKNKFTPIAGNSTCWTNGYYTISWLYDDIVICNKHGNCLTMQGGDFESLLSSLLKIHPKSVEELY